MRSIYMSFGANIGDPIGQILSGLAMLKAAPEIHKLRSSALFQTPPMGPDQPDYLNGVAHFYTTKNHYDILNLFQAIEQNHGRDRQHEIRWGPRSLDFDILMIDQLVHKCPRLEIPHPGLLERPFVLIPLAQLDPNARLPNGSCAKIMANKLSNQNITCVYHTQGITNDSDNQKTQPTQTPT